MSSASDYYEGQLIDHTFRTASFTKPTVLAVALFTSAPSDSGGGTEVTGGSYARVDVPPLDANWAAPSAGDGVTSNVNAITFPAPTANWGTVTHFAIFDALSGGNMIVHGALGSSELISNGDPAPEFAAGAFTVTFA